MEFNLSRHDFNSDWHGSEFGISQDLHLLQATAETVQKVCSHFSVVELRVPSESVHKKWDDLGNGFKEVDLTIGYRLNAKKFANIENDMNFVSSAILPIDLQDFAEFSSERYLHLPNMTVNKLSRRYQNWAANLIKQYPETCGTILNNDTPSGYVFGNIEGDRANFTLGVASKKSNVFGLAFYQKAIQMFYQGGAKSIFSSFSASNIRSLNLHAALGCRFLSSTAVYFWVNPEAVK
jgi:hypothetical protein